MSKEEVLIELPEVGDIREILSMAKKDIAEEVKENEELKVPSELLLKVIHVIEEKVKNDDISKFGDKERIDLAAHLNFLHTLLEDFFFDEEMFEDFEDEDLEEEEDEE